MKHMQEMKNLPRMKNIISEMKMTPGGFNYRLYVAEKFISELEYMAVIKIFNETE